MTYYLETERLILRDIRPSDKTGMFELDSDPLVHKYLGNNPLTQIDQIDEVISFIRRQYDELGIGRFAVIEKKTGDFIGWSGIKLNVGEKEALNGKQNFYDIGYRLIPRFWGKGYATESSIACLDYAFTELPIDVLCGAAEIENEASNVILQKIGLRWINEFDFDGKKAHWYELKKEDYEKNMS